MKAKETKTDVGVIVGRFQVHELHEGHRGLIDTVRDKHDKLIMFLGLARLRNTLRTPLDFRARRQTAPANPRGPGRHAGRWQQRVDEG